MASLLSPSSPNPVLPSSKPFTPPDLPSMASSPRSPPPAPTEQPPEPAPLVPAEKPTPESSSRRQRLPRACTSRPARQAAPPPPPPERRVSARRQKEEEPQSSGRVVTPLVPDPAPADLPRWQLRSMWQLASVLNFLHVFRHLLNISAEFTAEELESALITPNSTLDDVHMPMLKSIPPVTRMALGRATWVTVLCRKLKDWWHWVAEGEIPIVTNHGAEIDAYKMLEPATRLLILKAICDIRVEQEDIKNYIDGSLKRGIQLSLFRKERIGGDSYGISYWYEDDPIIGHRLYREIRKVEMKKPTEQKKSRRKVPALVPVVSYQWETVATNFDEFQDVSEKLFSSTNRTEVSLGKKLKIDYLPDIEKIHKRKEKLLKKQQREALLLDSYLTADVTAGRSLRDRKHVTYTFDDYDRSINEAIKLTKKRQSSPEAAAAHPTRRVLTRHEISSNGKPNGLSAETTDEFYRTESPKSDSYGESDGEQAEPLDRSNRRRKRPRRFSEDFIDGMSDYDPNYIDSDDDIVGEAVYDDEYLKSRRPKSKHSSSSEGDEEFRLDDEDETPEEEEELEEEESEEYSISSDDGERNRTRGSSGRQFRKLPGRNRRAAKVRRVDELQAGGGGLRRSKRNARPRINYRKYEISDESDTDEGNKSDAEDYAYSEPEQELSTSSQDRNEDEDNYNSNDNNNDNDNNEDDNNMEYENEKSIEYDNNDDNNNKEVIDEKEGKQQKELVEKMDNSPSQENEGEVCRRFLDLNEIAPDGGFDDGPGLSVRDDDTDGS